MEDGLLFVLTAAVMAVGLAGVILPLIPGLGLIWLSAIAYGLVTGLGTAGWIVLAILTLLLAAGTAAGVLLPARGSRARGASTTVLVAGALGALVGFFIVPVVGAPLGAVAGVLLVQYRRTGGWEAAWAATKGVLLGFGQTLVVQLGIGIVMIVTWAIWAMGRL
jgi:uncharacterized protein YqgC (DUF456 family)